MVLLKRTAFLLCFLIVAAAEALAQNASGFGRFHALLIGNQNYQHLPPLRTPKKDVEGVAEVLKKQYGFTTEPLIDQTREEILLALARLRETFTKEDDNLLIYYAGHGFFDEWTKTGYLQPVDAKEENRVNWIPTDDITRELNAIRAKHILIVADSCYSGSLLMRDSGVQRPPGVPVERWLQQTYAKQSRTALTSGGLELVADGGGDGHSVFANALLEVLRENNGILDGHTLAYLIKRPVALNSEQIPQYSDIRMTGHKQFGDFLFVPKVIQPPPPPKPERPKDLSPLQRSGEENLPKQGDTMTDPVTGMEFVYIPGGCFQMGSATSDEDHQNDEGPVHEACVDGFWMGKYEVTQGQWEKVMGDNPSYFKKGSSYPVETVFWDDTKTFIGKLNKQSGKAYRLPTEAEWEYACRAGGSGKYCGGDDLDAVAWYGKNSGDSTHPVGKKQKNDFGLYDMSGNVWEWCADWYGEDYYASRPDKEKNPLRPSSGSYRVIRGGGWDDTPWFVRAAYRLRSTPDYRDSNLGFRLLLPGQQSQAGR